MQLVSLECVAGTLLKSAVLKCFRVYSSRKPRYHVRMSVIHIHISETETGEVPVLDPDFAADVEHILRNRKPWNLPAPAVLQRLEIESTQRY